MKVLGIIAEYNPFHLGHAYHIAQAKEAEAFAGVIAVMSGHFTQRGEAAIFDKWIRAGLALHHGVDLVLELPVAFATRSANYFAAGGMLTLAATGIVTHFSCGVESAQPQVLHSLAQILASEPADYLSKLQEQRQKGLSFPAAQQKALLAMQISGAEALDQPNNLLALNYLQMMYQRELSLTPILIPRQGSYHSQEAGAAGQFASATAIRSRILQRDDSWQEMVPAGCAAVIKNHLAQGYPPLENQDFSQAVLTLLRRATPAQLSDIIEVSEGLEHRITAAASSSATLEAFLRKLKTKRYPYTRLQRFLIHLLLNYTKETIFERPAYLRVLGFNDQGQQLLKAMKTKATLPVLVRAGADGKRLCPYGQKMLALDIRATDLYTLGYQEPQQRQGALDYQKGPVRI